MDIYQQLSGTNVPSVRRSLIPIQLMKNGHTHIAMARQGSGFAHMDA
jgi:hypothetical protein